MQVSLLSRLGVILAASGLVLLASGCLGGSKRARRYNKQAIQKRLQTLEDPGLEMGVYPLVSRAVVDGDTIKVAGLKTSLRLLFIDTEETFKSDRDRRLLDTGWENYWRVKNEGAIKPVKAATPLGEDAKEYAKVFFDGVEQVRLERDHPMDIRGRFNRYLAYVFAKKKGEWVNYNLECVRAGMSPYFTKYSYSRRFHPEFVRAQEEAKAARRGIWAPGAAAYSDYPERLKWWNARADFIKRFEEEAKDKSNYVVLTHWDAMSRLEKMVNTEVVLLATVGQIKLGDRGPTRVMLSRRLNADFPLIFFDKDVFGSSRIARYKSEFVRVSGIISKYHNKFKNRHELQIVVSLPSQIVGADNLPDYSRRRRR